MLRVTFVVENKPKPSNLAYTSNFLGLHTDLPYMTEPPGVRLPIHFCIRNLCYYYLRVYFIIGLYACTSRCRCCTASGRRPSRASRARRSSRTASTRRSSYAPSGPTSGARWSPRASPIATSTRTRSTTSTCFARIRSSSARTPFFIHLII